MSIHKHSLADSQNRGVEKTQQAFTSLLQRGYIPERMVARYTK